MTLPIFGLLVTDVLLSTCSTIVTFNNGIALENCPKAWAVIERRHKGCSTSYRCPISTAEGESTWRDELCNVAPLTVRRTASLRGDCTPPTHPSFFCHRYPGSQIQRLAASMVILGHRFDHSCSVAACTSAST